MLRALALAVLLQVPSSTEPPPYRGLAVWSENWGDVCALSGFWQPFTKGESTRLRSRRKGTAITMSSRLSLREYTYPLPPGGEVVFHEGWIFISGNGDALRGRVPSMAKLWGNKVNRDGEISKMVNADYVERVELANLSDWFWTKHDCKELGGWELFNGKAKAGTLVGTVYEARGPRHTITACEGGTRFHMCSPKEHASITYNDYQSPEAAKAAHEAAMAKLRAQKAAKAKGKPVEAGQKRDK